MSEINVPAGWAATTLGATLLAVVGGGTPSRKVQHYFDGNIPWFTVKDMKTSHPNDALEHISHEAIGASATNLIPANTLILATRIALGKAIRPTVDCAINQDLKALFFGKDIDPNLILYWVEHQADRFKDLGSGTTVSGIRLETLHAMPLNLPPAKEQLRLTTKIEETLSNLDAGIIDLKAAQKKLSQYRQSLLKAAVEGTLTADWRSRNPPSETGAQLLEHILAERRARWEAKQLAKFKEQDKTPPKGWQSKYPEPVTPDTRGLPALPPGWVWASVEQLGDVQLGRQRSPDKMKGLCPTKYIRAANITEQGINFDDVLEMDFDESERKTFALHAGDVLLTEASGSPAHVGRPVIWPNVEGLYCFQNTVLRFTPAGIRSAFAFRIFHAWQKLGVFSKLSGGVGINHLSAGKFAKLAMPLPSLAEQDACVSMLETTLAMVAEQEQCITHSLNQAAAQRKNILKTAFAGQLVPQDPSDEPASVLLARIREARAARTKVKKTGGAAKQTSKQTKSVQI